MANYSGSITLDYGVYHTIYRKTYLCKVQERQFNLSYNPSLSGESGSLYNFVTGSQFQPYVTTIGLYDDNNELLMYAKLSAPVPVSRNVEMTFEVQLDF